MLEWKRHLNKSYAEATVAGTFAKTKAVFNWAVEKGWIETTPLQGISGGTYSNQDNDRFIEVDEYHRLLKACPCQEWRVIITLVRIGGLRCPSEVLRVRWNEIHWEKKFFMVTSPKLEHHKGKGWRYVPIFPEIRQELEALRSTYQGEEPEFVIGTGGRCKKYENNKNDDGDFPGCVSIKIFCHRILTHCRGLDVRTARGYAVRKTGVRHVGSSRFSTSHY